MNKIIDSIKSLFIPAKLKDNSNMSSFIAVLIFLLGLGLLYIGAVININTHKDEYIEGIDYANVLYHVDDLYNTGIDGIKSSNYKVVKNDDNYVLTSFSEEGIKKYTYSFEMNEQLLETNFVFDLYGTSDKEIKEIADKYKEKYDSDGSEKASYAATIIYTEVNKGKNLDERIEYYHTLSISDIKEEVAKLTYYDYYDVTKKDNGALIVFFDKYIMLDYSSNLVSSSNHIATIPYDNIKLNMEEVHNINDFSRIIAQDFIKTGIDMIKIYTLIRLFVLTFILPAFLAFVFFLFFKGRAVLHTFKEFYNITALASIFPFIISFIFTFILKGNISAIFVTSLSIISITYFGNICFGKE